MTPEQLKTIKEALELSRASWRSLCREDMVDVIDDALSTIEEEWAEPVEAKYDTHEKRVAIAAERYPGDPNALNDHRHVTLTKMNLRNGYAMALKEHAAALEASRLPSTPQPAKEGAEPVETAMKQLTDDEIECIAWKCYPHIRAQDAGRKADMATKRSAGIELLRYARDTGYLAPAKPVDVVEKLDAIHRTVVVRADAIHAAVVKVSALVTAKPAHSVDIERIMEVVDDWLNALFPDSKHMRHPLGSPYRTDQYAQDKLRSFLTNALTPKP